MYAETARAFLRLWLEEVSGDGQLYEITENPLTFNAKGMYVIWYKHSYSSQVQDKFYPMYVGITSRKFSTRFNEHYNSGKIDQNLTKQKNVFASVMPMDLPLAKFLESTLLVAFNFALNKQENDEVRQYLVMGAVSVEKGQLHFAGILKNYVSYLEFLKNIEVRNVGHKDVIN